MTTSSDENVLRSDANQCFVCGPANPIGLKLEFRLDDGICRSEFTPAAHHCGYDGVTHGGLIYSALDDVMANWLFLQGKTAFTAKCEVRYRDHLPTGTPVFLEGHMVRQKGRLTLLKGLMIRQDNNAVVAEADASFMMG